MKLHKFNFFWFSIGFALAALVSLVIFHYLKKGGIQTSEVRRAHTSVQLIAMAQALHQYYAEFGNWPSDLEQLRHNSKGIRFYDKNTNGKWEDAWGHALLYTPPRSAADFGTLGSFGRDRKAGGHEEDADLILQFNTEVFRVPWGFYKF